MARTACWRMHDGKLVEKVVEGSEVPEGWFDNPRLEENARPEVGAVAVEIPGDIDVMPEPEVVVTNVVDEKVSEPDL